MIPIPLSVEWRGGTSSTPVKSRAAGLAVRSKLVTGSALGSEGYELDVSGDSAEIRAPGPAGLFYGAQTLRQLPPGHREVRIVDRPRFQWRGAALDVARHFLAVEDVKRYIDLISSYKLNVLHLHLTDDQGWRIAIESWPRLALHGGTTQVGGGPGGFYGQGEFAEIVRYARDRFVTIVPEIDVPGHTNAALASYGELTCEGHAPDPYTGIEVGFSSLCVDKEVTYRFLDDVVGEMAALTPGPYIHIGGDEVKTLPDREYASFIERALQTVRAHGKTPVGWQEIAKAGLAAGTVAQYWDTRSDPFLIRQAALAGTKLVLSPADRVYLDMKYTPETPIGLQWAGCVDVRQAYEWDPAKLISGVEEEHILGVEAPLWGETVRGIEDVEFLALPRLAGVAEIAWSRQKDRSWESYRSRLAAEAVRWESAGINFYRSSQVPWRAG